jgi:O-antigen/teichoic acid export membrane protein
LFGIYYNFSTWYKVTDKTSVGTIISWLGAGINIALNLLALKYYHSMMGSAWATFGAYAIMMIISYLLGQKYYPIPYRMKKMSFFLILLGVFSFIIVKYFNYNILMSNALFITFTGILIYSEKNAIIKNQKINWLLICLYRILHNIKQNFKTIGILFTLKGFITIFIKN